MANQKTNEALVFGILSLVFSIIGLIVLAIVFCPLGILMGILGLTKNKTDIPSIIGITISAIGLLLYVIFLLV